MIRPLLVLLALVCTAAAAQGYSDYVDDGVVRSTRPALGERFPDLAFTDAKGRKLSVSALAGRVAVLHFWGSWCGPCRRELPDLQRLYDGLKDRRDIVFVLLQVREPIKASRQWAAAQRLRLPLYDSGAKDEMDAALRLADGSTVRDRDIAPSFPTTYVVDKRGVVIFSHIGAVSDWSRQRDLLMEAAARPVR